VIETHERTPSATREMMEVTKIDFLHTPPSAAYLSDGSIQPSAPHDWERHLEVLKTLYPSSESDTLAADSVEKGNIERRRTLQEKWSRFRELPACEFQLNLEEGELEELQESVRFAEEEKLIAMQQLCQEIANMVNAGDVLAAINTITEHNDKTIRIVSETNALYSMNDSFRKQDMDSSVAVLFFANSIYGNC